MDKRKNFFSIIIFGFIAVTIISTGIFLNNRFGYRLQATADNLSFDEQEATILAVKKIMPAVVSIIVYDEEQIVTLDLGTGVQTANKEKVQKGSGTGFLISVDGLIVTNKHVVNSAPDNTAAYRVILNSGKEYYAQLIGRDPIKDLAVLKIFDKNLPYVELGDSDKLEIGATVIAIGNALGRYQNSATKGIVSGLGRSIQAADTAGQAEVLDNVIQTDAEINPGNSGGPLVDLSGKVVGVNTAIDQEGTAIGFAIPINDVRTAIASVKTAGRIIRPRLGLRYLMLTPQIALDNGLTRQSGAWIVAGKAGEPAVVADSPSAKAGILTGDIIFEINGVKIEGRNTLLSIVQKYKPGEKIGLKILRGNKIIIRTVTLDEYR
jgi:serine protease Do